MPTDHGFETRAERAQREAHTHPAYDAAVERTSAALKTLTTEYGAANQLDLRMTDNDDRRTELTHRWFVSAPGDRDLFAVHLVCTARPAPAQFTLQVTVFAKDIRPGDREALRTALTTMTGITTLPSRNSASP